VGRGENPEEKTVSLAKDVRIVIEGVESKLTDVKIGEDSGPTTLRLSLDGKTAQSVTVGSRVRGRE
jgi:hypothetical protein